MANLWEVLEEEKVKAQAEKMRKEKEEIVKKQYNEIRKEYHDAFTVVEANYVFNCFLLDIFPKYIKGLIKNNHNALLNGNSIKCRIFISLKKDDDFETAAYYASNFYACGERCTNEMIGYNEDNKLTLYFKDKLIYNVFKEKLNLFLIKNNIINFNAPKDSNLISYANPIYFEVNIEDLIKAYENGLQQIEEEKETLNSLMESWNIKEGYTIYCLGVTGKYYKGLLNSAKKGVQLARKK